jgi:hypothetical protein
MRTVDDILGQSDTAAATEIAKRIEYAARDFWCVLKDAVPNLDEPDSLRVYRLLHRRVLEQDDWMEPWRGVLVSVLGYIAHNAVCRAAEVILDDHE